MNMPAQRPLCMIPGFQRSPSCHDFCIQILILSGENRAHFISIWFSYHLSRKPTLKLFNETVWFLKWTKITSVLSDRVNRSLLQSQCGILISLERHREWECWLRSNWWSRSCPFRCALSPSNGNKVVIIFSSIRGFLPRKN